MRVLSIDLDYISEPAINDNNRFEDEDNPQEYDQWAVVHWQQLFEDYPHDISHRINLGHYDYCLRVFLRALRTCHDVHFGYDHDNILYGLEGHSNLDIINIDHHDDVFAGIFEPSPDYEADILKHMDRVMEGNWALWLHQHGRLNSYTWIGDDLSDNISRNDYVPQFLPNYTYSTREEWDWQDNYEFDQIFICLSPQYIPPLHWHFFSTFMVLYEEITGKKINTDLLHRKYEMKYYYKGVTDFVTKGTQISKGKSAPRIIY